MPGFIETISLLFEHFKKCGINSSIQPEADFNQLACLFMEAELKGFSYYQEDSEYTVDFITREITEDIVYYFLFSDSILRPKNTLLIELWINGPYFIRLSIKSNMYIPLARGFLDYNGLMPIHVYDHELGSCKIEYIKPVIMSNEEFHGFLQSYTCQGKVIGIEVE